MPTPLNAKREPDLEPVLNTGATIAAHIRAGQLIVVGSSTYPGTTDEELENVLSTLASGRSGLLSGLFTRT